MSARLSRLPISRKLLIGYLAFVIPTLALVIVLDAGFAANARFARREDDGIEYARRVYAVQHALSTWQIEYMSMPGESDADAQAMDNPADLVQEAFDRLLDRPMEGGSSPPADVLGTGRHLFDVTDELYRAGTQGIQAAIDERQSTVVVWRVATIAATIAIFAIIAALLVWIRRTVTRSVDGIIDYTRRIADGDYAARLRTELSDDLRELYEHTTVMVNNIVQLAGSAEQHQVESKVGDVHLEWTYHPIRDAGHVHVYFTDVTDRKRAEAQLLHDAFHDSLTGLPNRALLADRLDQTIALAGEIREQIARPLELAGSPCR